MVLCYSSPGTLTHRPPALAHPPRPACSFESLPLTIAALLSHHHHVRLLQGQLVILSGFVGSKALNLWGVFGREECEERLRKASKWLERREEIAGGSGEDLG